MSTTVSQPCLHRYTGTVVGGSYIELDTEAVYTGNVGSFESGNITSSIPKHGEATLVIGPMFSGKSSHLKMLAEVHRVTTQDTLCIIYKKDVGRLPRFDSQENELNNPIKLKASVSEPTSFAALTCHSGAYLAEQQESKDLGAIHVLAVGKDELSSITPLPKQTLITLDEGQFFKDSHIFVKRMLESGRDVIISALNSDFEQKTWPEINKLHAHIHTYVIKTATCMYCKQPRSKAIYNICLHPTKVDADGELISGKEDFKVACSDCFTRLTNVPSVPVSLGGVAYQNLASAI